MVFIWSRNIYSNFISLKDFGSFDIALDPMTLLYELDLKILKLYVHHNKRLGQGFQSYRITNGHTDTQTGATKHTTTPCSQVKKMHL